MLYVVYLRKFLDILVHELGTVVCRQDLRCSLARYHKIVDGCLYELSVRAPQGSVLYPLRKQILNH